VSWRGPFGATVAQNLNLSQLSQDVLRPALGFSDVTELQPTHLRVNESDFLSLILKY